MNKLPFAGELMDYLFLALYSMGNALRTLVSNNLNFLSNFSFSAVAVPIITVLDHAFA